MVFLETGTRVELYWEYFLAGMLLSSAGLLGNFAFDRVKSRYLAIWFAIFTGVGTSFEAYAVFHSWLFPVILGSAVGALSSWAFLWGHRFRQKKGSLMFRHPRGDFRLPPLPSREDHEE